MRPLNSNPVEGKCVLYVMSRDQRVADNFALVAAQQTALELHVPLAVIFCLQPHNPDSKHPRAREHYQWMIKGLHHVEADLADVGIPFMMLIGKASERLSGMIHHTQPAAVYFDNNPLRGPRALQANVAKNNRTAVFVVDNHNIVPVWEASDKQEYAARTMRPKIHKQLPIFLVQPEKIQKHPHQWPGVVKTLSELKALINESVEQVPSNGQELTIESGEKAAAEALDSFVRDRLSGYADNRNNPSLDAQSELSPHLHFGQLWAGKVALEVMANANEKNKSDVDAFIEELVVRKELSDNYCYYNQNYDNLNGAANWARETLIKHAKDPREYVYTKKQLERSETHDPAWNAAQTQLVKYGKIHGYMRMYWAKKVLEWTASPQEALDILQYLNDFYSIDGGDPNGYVGILWSVAGLHDRPWFERSVYGTVRYMNYNGLKKKFDIQAYQDSLAP